MSNVEQTLRVSEDGPLSVERLRWALSKLPDHAEMVSVQVSPGGWSIEARWVNTTKEIESRAGHRQHGVLAPRGDDYVGPYGSGVSFYDSH